MSEYIPVEDILLEPHREWHFSKEGSGMSERIEISPDFLDKLFEEMVPCTGPSPLDIFSVPFLSKGDD